MRVLSCLFSCWLFFSPLATHAADLSASVLQVEQQALVTICNGLVKRAHDAKDDAKPVIYQLVTDPSINKAYWSSYIKHLFNNKILTPHDLMFVIDEYSKNNVVKKEEAEKIYKELIIDNLKNSLKQRDVVDWLTKIAIHNGGYVSDKNHQYYGSASADEYHSVLGRMIEKGYKEAFKGIVQEWPDAIGYVWLQPACSRKERDDAQEHSFWQGYKYVDKSYNIAEWLLRSKANEYHRYLDMKKQGRENYNEAAKMIVDHAWEKKISLDGHLFTLAAILEKNNKLCDQSLLSTWVQRLKNTHHMKPYSFTVPQLSLIQKKFPDFKN